MQIVDVFEDRVSLPTVSVNPAGLVSAQFKYSYINNLDVVCYAGKKENIVN